MSFHIIWTNLLVCLVIIRYSTYLRLILFVTFLCLNSKERFLTNMSPRLTRSAIIGKAELIPEDYSPRCK